MSCYVQHFEPLSNSTFLISGVLLGILCVTGLIGNGSSIFLLTKRFMKRSIFRWYLNFLCLADCLTLLSSLFCVCIPVVFYNSEKFRPSNLATLVVVFYPLMMTSHFMAAWGTVAISAVRFVAVKFPVVEQMSPRKHVAGFSLLTVTIFAIAFNITRVLELRLSDCAPDRILAENGSKMAQLIEITSFRGGADYQLIYLGFANGIALFVLAMTALLLLNLTIATVLFRTYTNRRKMSTYQPTPAARQMLINWLLLSISAVFIICRILPFLHIIEGTRKFYQDSSNVTSMLPFAFPRELAAHFNPTNLWSQISVVMIALNASLNYIVYLMFNSKFRKHLGTTFSALQTGLHSAAKTSILPLIQVRNASKKHVGVVQTLSEPVAEYDPKSIVGESDIGHSDQVSYVEFHFKPRNNSYSTNGSSDIQKITLISTRV